MKKTVLLAIAFAASVAITSAQTTPSKKSTAKKECCKKEGSSCCSPSSKAKALTKAKPATTEKKG